MQRLIRLPEVMQLTGLCRSEIYRLASLNPPEFPKPCPLGERSSAWVLQEVEQFVSGRIAAREQEARERRAFGQRLAAARASKSSTAA